MRAAMIIPNANVMLRSAYLNESMCNNNKFIINFK